jgi:hypothetical protein
LVVRAAPTPAHVSVVILPEPTDENDHYPEPADALRSALHDFFDVRRTLTTRHHMVGPHYVEVTIGASLALHEDALTAEAAAAALIQARTALIAFFHPLSGGPDRLGWPFGRAIYASEVYAVLEQIPLVNYVEDVTLAGTHPLTDEDGRIVGIRLDAHELVRLEATKLVAYDVHGYAYQE